MNGTPTPGVSVTPTCGTLSECRRDKEAALGGGAILIALIAAILIIAAIVSMRRNSN